MNTSEKLCTAMQLLRGPLGWREAFLQVELRLQRLLPGEARLEPLHRQIDDRRGVEREQLAQQQAADDGDAERVAQFRTRALLECEWDCAEQGGERRHHD